MDEILRNTFLFLFNMVSDLLYFIGQHKLIFACFFVPVVAAVIGVVIDFIFDVRDDFTDFHDFQNFGQYIKYRYSKRNKQKRVDMEEVYQKSRENADYKHNLKMKEYEAYASNAEVRHAMKMEEIHYFHENEEKRHQHKQEENQMYKNNVGNLSKPNVSRTYTSTVGDHETNRGKTNIDISVED